MSKPVSGGKSEYAKHLRPAGKRRAAKAERQFATHRLNDPHCTCNDCIQYHARCQWFAGCTNPATSTQHHPVLGEVPICARCFAWYERMGQR